ncbi:hypothetical protein HK099_005837 [Clydaea vesicula]|uniref:Uncharacterized protein n=1 Tax=Clydaea vesicula TaxID=447962 RepID=A0AAD5U110_9FUNG|nr:hypothetical protein HK099_005837 [Clydaea vesicula]
MSEIVFPSFVRRFGYKITTSASDGVYSSLLDCGGDWIDRYAYGDIPMDIAMNRVNLNSASSRLGVLKGGVKRHDESVDGRGYGQQQGRVAFNINILRILSFLYIKGVGVGTKTGLAAIGLRLIEFSEGLSKYQKSSLKSGEESEEVDEDEKWVKNFWVAFDSLENSDLMVYGIHLSMQFQATLVETGVSILERSIVRSFKKFRLGVLNNGTGISITSNNNQENRSLLNFLNEKEGNQNQKNNSGKPQSKRVKTSIDKEFSIFSKSSTHLKKLSKFILEAFQACNYTSLPLILAFLNEENDTFLCCGTMLLSKKKKSKFGIAFQESAELSGAKVKHDSFDVCVIEIKREDLMDFIEKLKLVL